MRTFDFYEVKAAAGTERDWVHAQMESRWGGRVMAVHGEGIDTTALPALVARERRGFLVYRVQGLAAEIVVMDALEAGLGIGTAMLVADRRAGGVGDDDQRQSGRAAVLPAAGLPARGGAAGCGGAGAAFEAGDPGGGGVRDSDLRRGGFAGRLASWLGYGTAARLRRLAWAESLAIRKEQN